MTNNLATVFLNHIREHATCYFKELETKQIEVKLVEKNERPASVLYEFSVINEEEKRLILVKIPYHRGRSASEADDSYFKPRLFPRTEPRDMHKLEYTALQTISDYFSSLDEKDLGTIRVLDYLPDYQAIFTEVCKGTNLRELLLQTNRLYNRFPQRELAPAFRNVGKWLRFYHGMPKEDNVTVRHTHRHEYIEAVCKLTGFLATTQQGEDFFQRITSVLESSALKLLPESLPIGLGHGDFAMRNILVGENAHITVIDTFAKWKAPIYEDIGYFINGLKMNAPQVMSQGLLFSARQLSELECAFLEGYYEQNHIPHPQIQLYVILAMLDKWASIVTRSNQRSQKFKTFRRTKTALTNRYFELSVRRLLNDIVAYEHA
jgi:hypothetical protein